jgi:N-methylhydantoinase B/oxoprolinase/acetone carboxylase alpha subunit
MFLAVRGHCVAPVSLDTCILAIPSQSLLYSSVDAVLVGDDFLTSQHVADVALEAFRACAQAV